MTIEIADWSPLWSEKFRAKAADIRRALGNVALRIDHIGSTAIAGMAAKPVIDMQISVAGFEPFERLLMPLNAIGYVWRQDNPDRAKRYFRESPDQERMLLNEYLRACELVPVPGAGNLPAPEVRTHVAVKSQRESNARSAPEDSD